MARFMRPVVMVGMLGLQGLACVSSQHAGLPASGTDPATSVQDPEAASANVVSAPPEAWGPFLSEPGQRAGISEETIQQRIEQLRRISGRLRCALEEQVLKLPAPLPYTRGQQAWSSKGPIFQLIPTDTSVCTELIPTDAWADVVLVGRQSEFRRILSGSFVEGSFQPRVFSAHGN